MAAERHLARVEPIGPPTLTSLPSAGDLRHLLDLSDVLLKSGLLPSGLRTKEAVAVVVLKGMELGLPPMAAMEGIAVVQGKAVVGSHLLLALVKRAYGPGAIWVSETTNERCTVSYRVPGQPAPLSYTFTIQDARTAGLAGKDNWKNYPAAMLRARAISATVKLAYPEVVGAMYVAGEVEGTVEQVTPDGEVIVDVAATVATEPAPRRVRAEIVPEPEPEPDDAPEPAAERPALNLGPLHGQIARVARNGGDGMDGDAVHQFLHDWAAHLFGVASLTELTVDQLNHLLRESRGKDAGWLAATWDAARAALADPGTGELPLPGMPADAGDADRWTR